MLQQPKPFVFHVNPELDDNDASIEALHELAFGPGRFARTAFRLREGRPAVAGLSFVANIGDRLVGSIRFGCVVLAGSPGLLLGPLVVHPDHAGRGVGLKLMQTALEAARLQEHAWVMLVGDEPYYARVGFSRVPLGLITLPGPVDPARLLFLELKPDAMRGLSGMLQAG